ncbi:hypothetical protein ACFSMW_19845 [Virgibacillus halophilus]|uniref:Uncharacterized protein n=1 Tax=Tigheibacillus halophilus TaxID=361280 RepID=A0ABU5C8Q1_9BACI|nr:hypothetical protein [Virgibacillus halophilus]
MKLYKTVCKEKIARRRKLGEGNVVLRFFLELIRVIFIMLICGVVLGALVNSVYKAFDIQVGEASGGWFPGIAILLLLFVWYRQRLQFTGFYKSKANQKLSKTAARVLIFISIILFILPALINV